jgi:hypothetical protein
MATESFTGTSGTELLTYSSNWNEGNMLGSDFVLDTNALRTPFARGITVFSFYDGPWTSDHYAEATITQFGTNDQWMGVCVRASLGNAYSFKVDTDGWQLDRTIGFGVPVSLASGSRTQSNGDVVRLSANGTRLVASINGSVLADVTDATHATGAPGVSGFGNAASGTYTLLDNWVGLDIVNGVGWTEGAGTVLATDDIGGVHHQRQKLTHGADGTAADASVTAPMPVRLAAIASGGATPYRLVSAVGTNSAAVKASPGTVYGLIVGNANSSPRYLKLYDSASAPTVGTTTPKMTIPVNRLTKLELPQGISFTSGIGIGLTTGAADSDTGGVAANELAVTVFYR